MCNEALLCLRCGQSCLSPGYSGHHHACASPLSNERMIEAVSEGVSGENVACYVWGGLVYKMLFFSACFLSLLSIGFADPKAWPWNDPEPPAAARLRSSRCVSV